LTEFAAPCNLGSTGVHNALVDQHHPDELIGHISRDSTAIIGRKKQQKKVKKPKNPHKRGRMAKGEQLRTYRCLIVRFASL
jgi:hypothetical protein